MSTFGNNFGSITVFDNISVTGGADFSDALKQQILSRIASADFHVGTDKGLFYSGATNSTSVYNLVNSVTALPVQRIWNGATQTTYLEYSDKALNAVEQVTQTKGGVEVWNLTEWMRQNLTETDFNNLKSFRDEMWRTASQSYANAASGRVYAILGETATATGNDFSDVELRALLNNPNVTHINDIPKLYFEFRFKNSAGVYDATAISGIVDLLKDQTKAFFAQHNQYTPNAQTATTYFTYSDSATFLERMGGSFIDFHNDFNMKELEDVKTKAFKAFDTIARKLHLKSLGDLIGPEDLLMAGAHIGVSAYTAPNGKGFSAAMAEAGEQAEELALGALLTLGVIGVSLVFPPAAIVLVPLGVIGAIGFVGDLVGLYNDAYGNSHDAALTPETFSNFVFGEGNSKLEKDKSTVGGTQDGEFQMSLGQRQIDGGAGNDSILALETDKIIGGDGDDLIAFYSPTAKSEIQGGAGNDWIVGSGNANIDGGAGDDTIIVLNYDNKDLKIHGGTGNDILIATGPAVSLFGDAGADTFVTINNTFVKDAGTEDRVKFGPFTLTGGVQQWWQEGGWAYWAPISGVLSTLPSFLSEFAYLGALLDIPAMAAFRYGLSQSGQLIIQVGGSLGLQSVVEDYHLDLSTGKATGGIVAFRQEVAKSGTMTLAKFQQMLNLAVKAGFGVGIGGQDPLVLDLDGDGLELRSRDAGDIFFEMDKDGFAEHTAWVMPDDAFLARDLNSNGKIDDASELFGNATETGFAALSKLDSNKDGKISSSDTAFGTLRVWQDLDQDGVTDAGELKTLTEAGIASISLSTTTPNPSVVNGNTIHAESVVTKTNGTTTKISDVELVTSETDTRYLGDTTVSAAAAALPTLRGYGQITDLRVAMSHNATLLAAMQSFVALSPSTSHASLKSSVETLLYRWAGVDGVAATALGSGFDLRKLAFIEKYFGYQLAPRDGNGQPLSTNVGELINLWNAALDKAFLRLSIQGPLKGQFPHVTFDPATGDFQATSTATLAEAFAGVLALLPSDHATALTAWNTDWAPMLANFAEALTRSDQNTVKVDYAVANLVRALDGLNVSLSLTELVTGLGYSGVQIGTAAGEQMSRNAGGVQVYVAGGGNDTITGGAGQDVYVFGRNFGQDTVIDAEGGNRQSGDRLRFALLNSTDVTIYRDGLDLIIQVKSSTDKVTVRNQFATADVQSGWVLGANYGVEDIQFADGVILEAQEIAQAVGQGTAGNDHMLGTIRNDWLQGNKGNDLLEGGDGGDIYFFNKGDGQDTIRDVMENTTIRTADTLFMMGGLSEQDIQIDRVGSGLHNGDNLLVKVGDKGDQILIEGQFFYTPLGFSGPFALENRIETIFFQIGQAWSWTDIQQKLIAKYTTDGNDTLYGFGTDDEFASSKGDDYINGGDGGDTYHFDLGSGKDTIADSTQYITLSMSDTLVFGAGITLADLIFTRQGASDDLKIGLKNNTTDSLTIQGQFAAAYLSLFSNASTWMNEIDTFKFADGSTLSSAQLRQKMLVDAKTSGDDKIYGFSSQDVLDGGAGNDYLWGGNDSDIYRFGKGYGHDTIDDGMDNILGGRDDKLVFNADVNAADVRFSRNGPSEDLTVTLTDGSVLTIAGQFSSTQTGPFGQIWFNRVDSFEFANGKDAALNADQVMDLVLTQGKTAGNDTLYGFARHDVLDGGAGNDYLDGGEDADTYIFGLGYGHDTIQDTHENILYDYFDTLKFGAGITIDDLLVTKVIGKEDISIAIKGTSDWVTLQHQTSRDFLNTNFNGVESFEFTNGTKLDKDTLRQMAITGQKTAGNDTIEGTHYGEVIEGGKGNDTINGAGGGDTYIFNKGDGQDVISDFIDNLWFDNPDTIKFGTGIATTDIGVTRNANDLILSIAGGTDKITVKDHFYGGATWDFFAIENFEFAGGTVWNQSDIKLKFIEQASTSGDDNIVLFDDDEVVTGGKGNDTISGGAGNDTYNYARGDGKDTIYEDTGSNDRLVFSNINSSAISSITRNGSDLTLVIAESVAGKGDGGSVTLKDNAEWWGNAQGVDKIVFADGTSWTPVQLRERYFAQQVTTGNDTITGFNGNDTISGGKGNDILYGNGGNDGYVYTRGDGDDVIGEGNLGGDNDRLVLANLNPADVALVRNGNDVTVVVRETAPGAGNGGSILLKDSFDWALGAGVEEILFADGTLWTRGDIQTRLIAAASTPGNDTITGTSAGDTIIGGKGNDAINGAGGNDTYVYARGDGNDTIAEGYWNGDTDTLLLSGITPSQVSLVRNGNDLTIVVPESAPGAGNAGSILLQSALITNAGEGVDLVAFSNGTTWTREELQRRVLAQASTAGNDTITGFNANDVITGGKGNDTLAGGEGDDTFNYTRGDGNDTIQEPGGGFDTLVLKTVAVSTVTLSSTAQDITLKIAETSAGAGNGGTILLTNSNNVGSGAGIDRVVFDDGTIWTEGVLKTILTSTGTAGNDEYSGNNSVNTLNGGKGNDVLVGQGGNDTYVYARGDGNDTIIESAGGGTGDKLTFTNINTNKVTISHSDDDVTITIAESAAGAGDGGSILLKGGLDENLGRGIDQIVFADATTWTRATLRQMLIDYAGTTGADTLNDTGVSHVISGGKGNDAIDGGGGDDIYLYRRGDGVDTLYDGTNAGYNDRLILVDINPASVSLTRDTYSNSVQLVIAESAPGAGDGGSILLSGGLVDDYGVAVDKVVFADGTIWTHADFRSKLQAQSQTSGNDTIYGFGYEEAITGGKGNDTIYGFGGNDTYVYSRGDGHDTIYEGTNEGGADRLVFTNINPSAVTLLRNGNDVKLIIAESAPGAGDAGSVLLAGAVEDYYWQGVDQIVFADGTVWQHANLRAMLQAQSQTAGNDTIIGYSIDDVLVGGTGDDVMDGQGGNDTYKYTRGDGNDTITDGTNGGSADKLIFTGVNATDITIQRDNADVRLIIAPSAPGATDGGSITLGSEDNYYWRGVDQIVFGNGESWTIDQLLGKSAVYRDLNGDNAVYGNNGADRIDAGLPGKNLYGREGSDTYVYAAGYGLQTIGEYTTVATDVDTVELTGLNAADVTLSRDWNTLDIIINASGEKLRVADHFVSATYGIEQIRFADGTIWDRNMIAAKYIYAGTAGNDYLAPGSAIADTISGFAGDDQLIAGDGNDTLIGGTGNDYLRGDAGSDTYVYAKGDGVDTIEDVSTSITDIDVLRLTDLKDSEVILSQSANDLLVTVKETGAVITVRNHFYSIATEHRGIEEIDFADGKVWTLATILQNAPFRGTAGNDSLVTGSAANDTIVGGLGNDYMQGNGGSDVYVYAHGDGNDSIDDESPSTTDIDVLRLVDLTASQITLSRNARDIFVTDNANGAVIAFQYQYYSPTQNWGIERIEFSDGTAWNLAQILANAAFRGTAGNDTIVTQSGDADTIIGGLGNDYVRGGAGSDIYVYARGDGNDSIDDESGSTSEIDVLRLVGIASTEVELTKNGALFVMDIVTGMVIDIADQYYSSTANWGIEQIEFGDGVVWNLAQINANTAIGGTAGNDTMNGTAGADRMAAGKGDDTYVVNDAGDVVIEQISAGTDLVQSSVTYTLTANVENLTLTGSTAINGTGNALNNTLVGNTADNILNGGAGADSLSGGTGNDTYVVDNAGDTVTENASAGTDLVQSSVSYALAINVENLTLTGSAAINGTGNSVSNKLTGNSADNILDGGAGNDIIDGAGGHDTATYAASTVAVVVNLTTGTNTGGDAQGDVLSNIENLTGSAFADTLTGNAAANILDGGAANDTMSGADGNDTYVVDNANDKVSETSTTGGTDKVLSSVTWILGTNVENLTLTGSTAINGTGNTLNNTLVGNTADNILDGGTGADGMSGGTGNDTYVVDNAGDTVTENASAGTDLVQSSVSFVLATNVENLTLTGSAAINGAGNSVSNKLTGNAADNILDGGAGNDIIDGAGGNDTATYAASTAAVVVNLTTGTNTGGYAQGDVLSNIENLTGSAFADTLTGNAAANILDGGAANDTMAGADGNDTYVVDNANDKVNEASATGGTDLVQSSVTWTLGTNVENLTLTGTGAINGTGNTLANTIIGNSGNNQLDGGTGNDTLTGGTGDDTYLVDSTTDSVVEDANAGIDLVKATVNFTLTANVENGMINTTTAVTLTGNDLANALSGNNGADTLSGGIGDDLLNGGLGNDTLNGDAGSDTASYAGSNAAVTVNLATGAVSGGWADGDKFTSIENLIGSSLADKLTGDGNDNVLTGGAAADTLDGGTGNDTASYTGSAAVTVNLTTGTNTGGDAAGDVLTSIENLIGSANNDTLTGNTGSNVLNGAAGNDTISGGAGNDTLRGGVGNDTLTGGDGADTYAMGRGDGADIVQNVDSDSGFDMLKFDTGIAADQVWFAQSGNDLIVSIIGTSDSATVQGWYTATANRVDRIQVSDGHYINAASVEGLRSAMAAFGPPPNGQLTLDATRSAALAPTIAASWLT